MPGARMTSQARENTMSERLRRKGSGGMGQVADDIWNVDIERVVAFEPRSTTVSPDS